MKAKSIIGTIVLIFALFITIGFSAFCSEMSISNLVVEVRVKEDIRVTSVELVDGFDNVVSDDLDYDVDSIMGNISFNSSDALATYKITVTNIGNVDIYIGDYSVSGDIGIEQGVGGPGKIVSALGGTHEMTVMVFPSNYENSYSTNFKIDLDFKRFFNVSYENINIAGSSVIEGESYSAYIGNFDINDISIYMGGTLLDSTNYSYNDGQLVVSNVTGDLLIKGPKTLNSVMRLSAISDSGINFDSSTGLDTLNNVAYVRNGTEGNTNPIYYYRGNVSTNNVLFGNYCWKIVRTTDTGGIKLLYNGVPSEDGTCDNTGTDSQLSTLKSFNGYTNSPAYAGYMYGTVYPFYTKTPSELSGDIVYSNNVTYESGIYTLTGEQITSSDWENDRTTLAKKYHYTCFTTGPTCEEVAYVSYFGNSTTIYYLVLNGAADIEMAKAEMFDNVESSVTKQEIDTWYASNLDYYTSLIEDTVYCNDRSLYSGSLKGKDVDAGTGYSMFGSVGRIYNASNPSLVCPTVSDSFTVSSTNGNGKLTYPVGLLTADEMTLFGHSRSTETTSTFLHTGQRYWAMSPYCFSYHSTYHFMVLTGLGFTHSGTGLGIRPAISLKENSVIVSGDGTVTSPYKIKSSMYISDSMSFFGVDSKFYYEPGMTWEEWVNSSYNTINLIVTDDGYVTDEFEQFYITLSDFVKSTDIINREERYYIRMVI